MTMTSKQPYLFLDIDGVLNPDRPAGPGWEPIVGAPAPLTLHREHGASIAALGLETWWLTTWRHLANEWVTPTFGWDPVPVVPDPPTPSLRFGERGLVDRPDSEHWWKGRALAHAAATGIVDLDRGFVWIDDQLGRGHWRNWTHRNNGLALQPRSVTGLSTGQLRWANDYIERRATLPS